MKKILSLVLALSLALSLSIPALAAESSMDNFQKINTYNGQFSDLEATHWATPVIQLCYEYGFMYGDNAGRFQPNGHLTVAEAIVMADRIHQIYTEGQSTLTNGDPWYQTYVDYALEEGIFTQGDFADYNAKITRAQMAYLFCNALPASVLPAINQVETLPDVAAGDPYAQEILTLYKAGVLTGNDLYGAFYPQNNIIRAEAAAILARIALPDQRQPMRLLKQVTWGSNVTLAVPQAAQEETNGSVYSLLSDRDQAGAILSTDENAIYQGMSITTLPMDMMDDLLAEGFGSTGMDLLGAKTTQVAFGALQAYRTTGTLSNADGSADCVIYTYISGSNLTMIALLAYDDPVLLQVMANNLQIGGAAASPKL